MTDKVTLKLAGSDAHAPPKQFRVQGLDVATIEASFKIIFQELQESDGTVVSINAITPGTAYTVVGTPKGSPKTTILEYFANRRKERPYCGTVSSFGLQIPFVERDTIGKVLWTTVEKHYEAYMKNSSSREDHKRPFCYGPPGSGKSRTAYEAMRLILASRPNYPMDQSIDISLRLFSGVFIYLNWRECAQLRRVCKRWRDALRDLRWRISRDLVEILNKAVTLFVCFANGTALNPEEDGLGIQTMVANRMLFGYFNPTITWPSFVKKMKKMEPNLTISKVFKIIREDRKTPEEETLCVYLNIDEFNVLVKKDIALYGPEAHKRILDAIAAVKDGDAKLKIMRDTGITDGYSEYEVEVAALRTRLVEAKRLSLFHTLMDDVGTEMCRIHHHKPRVFLIPLASGTTVVPMTALGLSSGHPVIPLENKLLSPNGRSIIFSKMVNMGQHWLHDWELDKYFLCADAAIGGWGRPLEYLLETLKDSTLDGTPLCKVNMEVAMKTIIQRIYQRYPNMTKNERDASDEARDINRQILKVAILGETVSRKSVISKLARVTWEDANEMGLIILGDDQLVKIPFLWVYLFRKNLAIEPIKESIWRLLISPDAVLFWQQWEDFVLGYLSLRVSLQAETEAPITINQVLPGLKASEELLQIVVLLQGLQPVEVDSQFPNTLYVHSTEARLLFAESKVVEWWKGTYVIKNAPNGDAVDIFVLVKTPGGKWIMLCFQCKWKEATTTTEMKISEMVLQRGKKAIDELFKDAQETLKNKTDSISKEQLDVLNSMDTIYIVVTNKSYDGTIPKGCAVICKENFKQFFGIFSDAAALAHRLKFQPIININLDSEEELCRLCGIKTTMARKIIAKRPFTSLEDLLSYFPTLRQYKKRLEKSVCFSEQVDEPLGKRQKTALAQSD